MRSYTPWGWNRYKNYFEFYYMGIFSLSLYLFNHLFTSVWTCEYLFWTVDCKWILSKGELGGQPREGG